MTSPAERYARLREGCAAGGLRITPQRDVLLRVLSRTTGHPTAGDLFEKVRRALPSVSHATVYRNVQELVRAGVLERLERAGGAVQFEVNREPHHHCVCRVCGRVWDVYLGRLDSALGRLSSPLRGFRIDRRELQLHGVCASCR